MSFSLVRSDQESGFSFTYSAAKSFSVAVATYRSQLAPTIVRPPRPSTADGAGSFPGTSRRAIQSSSKLRWRSQRGERNIGLINIVELARALHVRPFTLLDQIS